MFNKKTRGVMKWVWGILVFLIILSMILLYSPVLYLFIPGGGGASPHAQPVHQQSSQRS